MSATFYMTVIKLNIDVYAIIKHWAIWYTVNLSSNEFQGTFPSYALKPKSAVTKGGGGGGGEGDDDDVYG